MFFLLPVITDRLLIDQKPPLSCGKTGVASAICNRVVTEAWDPEVLYANPCVVLLQAVLSDCTYRSASGQGRQTSATVLPLAVQP